MKRIVITTAVLALACAGLGTAQAAPAQYKVTGGGQNMVPVGGGAGDTIAFNARSTGEVDNAAEGQLQFVDRDGSGTGKGGTARHGVVDCVLVFATDADGGMAVVGGTFKDDGSRFTLDVIDAGEGKGATDVVEFRDSQSPTCEERDDDDDAPTEMLTRGNVQVHKVK